MLMRTHLSWRIPPLLAATLLLAVGCESAGPSGPDVVGSPRLAIDSVGRITPGSRVRVYGRKLDLVQSLSVDGVSTAFERHGAGELSFVAEAGRACDVDGRPITVALNDTVTATGRLAVEGTVSLRLAESRVLVAQDFASCLQLPAGQEFVITTLNPATDTSEVQLLQAEVGRSGGAAPAPTLRRAPAASLAQRAESARGALHASLHSASLLRPSATVATSDRGPWSDHPVPFDARYATAELGDTVRFIDWKAINAGGRACWVPRAEVPTYPARVIAMDDSKSIVWAVDMRLPNASLWYADAAVREDLRRLSNVVAPWLEPAARAVFDPAYVAPRGGGGRVWVMVGSFPSQVSMEGATGMPQSICPNASEMITIGWPSQVMVGTQLMYAGVLAHEYGHNAEYTTTYRYALRHPRIFTESWANVYTDVATRMASRQNFDATLDLERNPQHLYFEQIGDAFWGASADVSPFTRGWGNYTVGAMMLLYARQLRGEDDLSKPVQAPTLIQRLGVVNRGSAEADEFAAVAADVGLAPTAFLDRLALLLATDDLVPADAADREGLPQFRAWKMSEFSGYAGRGLSPRRPPGPDPEHTLAEEGRSYDLGARGGSYAALYFIHPDARGATLRLRGREGSSGVIRLTRIR